MSDKTNYLVNVYTLWDGFVLLFACKDVDSRENSILGEFPTVTLLQK